MSHINIHTYIHLSRQRMAAPIVPGLFLRRYNFYPGRLSIPSGRFAAPRRRSRGCGRGGGGGDFKPVRPVAAVVGHRARVPFSTAAAFLSSPLHGTLIACNILMFSAKIIIVGSAKIIIVGPKLCTRLHTYVATPVFADTNNPLEVL